MASRNTLRQNKNKGFTLIEILIAIVILAVIFSFALFISLDFYKSYAFRSEKNTIVSVLQRVRNQSLNNINQTRHAVHFADNPLRYIIYECPDKISNQQCDWAPNSTDMIINSSYGISITAPSLPFDVVFDQLNGNCISSNCATSPLAIIVSYGAKSYNITINSEGQIDWQ